MCLPKDPFRALELTRAARLEATEAVVRLLAQDGNTFTITTRMRALHSLLNIYCRAMAFEIDQTLTNHRFRRDELRPIEKELGALVSPLGIQPRELRAFAQIIAAALQLEQTKPELT